MKQLSRDSKSITALQQYSRYAALLLLPLLLAGCGSLFTLQSSDEAVRDFLRDRGTRCEHLSRTYSGVQLDFCWLNAAPGAVQGSAPMVLLILDAAASSLVDTIALPVTIPLQRRKGDIPLH